MPAAWAAPSTTSASRSPTSKPRWTSWNAGVEIVAKVERGEGPIKYAFVEDSWGTLIEIVEEPQIVGFHHVHLATTEPKATLAWYADAFGGQPGRFAGLIGGVRFGDMWVLVKGVDEPRSPTKGRATRSPGLVAGRFRRRCRTARAKGVKFVSGPTVYGKSKIAFIESPDGVLIELVGQVAKP